MLYLWRRLHPDSGGPGYNRGGLGIDLAWVPWSTDGLTGTLENAMAEVPSRGMLGGYPGATNSFSVVRETGIVAALAEGRHLPQSVAELGGAEETLANHVAGVPLARADAFRQVTGGGAAMGDPLLRDPERVAADVRDGYISQSQAELAYGVVADTAGDVDLTATDALRARLRAERIGDRPAATPAPITGWRPALRLVGDEDDRRFACGHCAGDLGAVAADWKRAAVLRRSDLAERLGELGVRVKGRQEGRLQLCEWACPHCGSLLETNLYPDGMAPLHDLHVGAGPGEEAALAKPV
jgi:N-methylhydantoinase B